MGGALGDQRRLQGVEVIGQSVEASLHGPDHTTECAA
jgi:hypothetical protein